jgi:hypothetical protein
MTRGGVTSIVVCIALCLIVMSATVGTPWWQYLIILAWLALALAAATTERETLKHDRT